MPKGRWVMTKKRPAPTCIWNEVGEMWETTCGEAFVVNDGTPSQNKMRFCCYCGKPLVEAKPRKGE
jgi:hypothetical protein